MLIGNKIIIYLIGLSLKLTQVYVTLVPKKKRKKKKSVSLQGEGWLNNFIT